MLFSCSQPCWSVLWWNLTCAGLNCGDFEQENTNRNIYHIDLDLLPLNGGQIIKALFQQSAYSCPEQERSTETSHTKVRQMKRR